MENAKIHTKTIKSFVSSLRIGEPTAYQNLTVFPLYTDQSREDGITLLDDAIKTEKFTVTEINEGGNVPELKAVNELDTDVLILDGEELVGAKQNRIVNTTIIIGMGKEVVIPVSCVEQGRWHYRSRKFSSGKSNLYADLRRKKAKAVLHSLKRNASYEADQHEIWDDIKQKAANFSVDSDTEAMNDIFESYDDEIKKYENQFKILQGQVGFVAMIGKKIAGLDIFGSRSVLPKIYSKILRGYIFDALDQDRAGRKKESLKSQTEQAEIKKLMEEVNTFLKNLETAKKESFKSVGEGNEFRFGNKQVNGFALVNNEEVVHMAAFAE
jgi:flavodoxin